MKNIQVIADKAAVSLSVLCVFHCLATPLLIMFIPTLAGLFFTEESFHLWMVVAVLPLSVYALTVGCKKHKRYRVLAIGAVGLTILIGAALFGHDLVGETGEKVLTVLGAAIIAVGHILNFRLCRQHQECN